MALHDVVRICAEQGFNFYKVRVMLLATGALLGGLGITRALHVTTGTATSTIDVFTTSGECNGIKAFLRLSAGLFVKASVPLGAYTVWYLRKGHIGLRLIDCGPRAMAVALLRQFTAGQGYCDGDGIRHPYPVLLDKGHTMTTPRTLPVEHDLECHIEVWKMIHVGIKYGFVWVSDFNEPHICGRAFSCPATFRDSRDAGWSFLRFPNSFTATRYSPERASWSLYGTGCDRGLLDDGSACPVPIARDDYWFATIAAFIAMPSAPSVLKDYNT
ncbi:hypothetical protein B0H15DRAFT_952765 [Mycena belliarum]|uniref:Uncharacterized protein n=1 Tax=Mycena belliarum TaxID=1033014 RepID=A0AAD6U238_9AGAR|nr:hypothetical protein B0H15DRAFT_952765 [Mycena belliae]